mgnify:CR=1 FL=1
MAAALTLVQAAQESLQNMAVQTVAGTLKTRIATFLDTIQAQLDSEIPENHPIINWSAVLYGYQTQMAGGANDYIELRISGDYVYRLCYMAAQSQDQSLITGAQAAAILAAYNANFGT